MTCELREWSLSAGVIRRGSFQLQPLGVFVLRCAIASRVGVREMHPHLVVAALVSFVKTQRVVGDGESTV